MINLKFIALPIFNILLILTFSNCALQKSDNQLVSEGKKQKTSNVSGLYEFRTS